ncbi:hypothetical protein HQ35_09710 [Porphyromonas cangingivalis]|uniref:Uncharacterized protein n=1 Tax=Porphyromonas cangingivalis TaxID=36874 RepID=A0A0A2ELE7_PORCN|nr:hypothetical protein [Porphyromonas cangingivalis]KGN78487.1 hypothetical protein HQ35_09710 [Porphyromonas cangingivalis]
MTDLEESWVVLPTHNSSMRTETIALSAPCSSTKRAHILAWRKVSTIDNTDRVMTYGGQIFVILLLRTS